MKIESFGDLLGFQHREVPLDHALITVDISPQLCNRTGLVHGGVVMAMMDAAGCWAAVPWNAPSPEAATASFSCNFLRGVNVNTASTLYAKAEIVKRGKALYFANVVVHAGEDGPIIATGQGVYSFSPKRSERTSEIAVTGF